MEPGRPPLRRERSVWCGRWAELTVGRRGWSPVIRQSWEHTAKEKSATCSGRAAYLCLSEGGSLQRVVSLHVRLLRLTLKGLSSKPFRYANANTLICLQGDALTLNLSPMVTPQQKTKRDNMISTANAKRRLSQVPSSRRSPLA